MGPDLTKIVSMIARRFLGVGGILVRATGNSIVVDGSNIRGGVGGGGNRKISATIVSELGGGAYTFGPFAGISGYVIDPPSGTTGTCVERNGSTGIPPGINVELTLDGGTYWFFLPIAACP